LNDQVKLDYEDEIALVTIANPPVNALGNAVRIGLLNAVEKARGAKPFEMTPFMLYLRKNLDRLRPHRLDVPGPSLIREAQNTT
jgi:hypothetical protein